MEYTDGDKPLWQFLGGSFHCPMCFIQMLVEFPIFVIMRIQWEIGSRIYGKMENIR